MHALGTDTPKRTNYLKKLRDIIWQYRAFIKDWDQLTASFEKMFEN
jgi:hypothetical protein